MEGLFRDGAVLVLVRPRRRLLEDWPLYRGQFGGRPRSLVRLVTNTNPQPKHPPNFCLPLPTPPHAVHHVNAGDGRQPPRAPGGGQGHPQGALSALLAGCREHMHARTSPAREALPSGLATTHPPATHLAVRRWRRGGARAGQRLC